MLKFKFKIATARHTLATGCNTKQNNTIKKRHQNKKGTIELTFGKMVVKGSAPSKNP